MNWRLTFDTEHSPGAFRHWLLVDCQARIEPCLSQSPREFAFVPFANSITALPVFDFCSDEAWRWISWSTMQSSVHVRRAARRAQKGTRAGLPGCSVVCVLRGYLFLGGSKGEPKHSSTPFSGFHIWRGPRSFGSIWSVGERGKP